MVSKTPRIGIPSCDVSEQMTNRIAHEFLIFYSPLTLFRFYSTSPIDKHKKLIFDFQATKRKIYDDAKSGRYDSTRSTTRSQYQPARDYAARHGSSRSYTDYSSRYSDYASSKSVFRGLFDKTFSRFFGGRFEKKLLTSFSFLCFEVSFLIRVS